MSNTVNIWKRADTIVSYSLSPDFQESSSEIIRLLGTIFMPGYTLTEKQKCLEGDFQIHDKMHYPVDAIIEAIREQFNLTQEEAEKYIEQALQLQKI